MVAQRYVTEQERREYGDAALSVMGRRAREIIDPLAHNLLQQNREIQQRLQKLQARDIYAALDQAQPDWRAINRDPAFWDWLRQPGELSGVEKQRHLNDAFSVGDASRVLAFFRGFLAAGGGQQSRSTSARSSSRYTNVGQPSFTRSQIAAFFEEGRKAAAQGKPPDPGRLQTEAAILAAAREGRVVNG